MSREDGIEPGVLRARDVDHWDDVPAGPPGSIPRWTGHLRFGDGLEVRLGDAASLVDCWPELVERLEPEDRATLLARYHGRDAGVDAHHTVVVDANEARAEVHRLDAPSTPDLAEPAESDRELTFWTSFHEGVRLGFAHWRARWPEGDELTWDARVAARGLRSARYHVGE